MKEKWISIKRFKCHEFHTTLRKLHREESSWPRRFEIISELEEKAAMHSIKMCAQVLLAYLLATSLRADDLLRVKVMAFEATIPAAYFLFASSFLFLITAASLCHLSVIMSLKSKESGKMLLPGFSSSIYGLLRGKQNDVSLGIPLFLNYFIEERFPVSGFLSFSLLLGLFSVFIPLTAFGYFILDQQLCLMGKSELFFLERIAAGGGIAITILSFLYVVLFHTPLPVKKNTRQIRWGFLVHLNNTPHPREGHWRGNK